jgi:hypothetical protein
MDREDLIVLCNRFVRRRLETRGDDRAPVWEIVQSYRHGEISESEKNSLLALVSDPDEEEVAGCLEDSPAVDW